MGKFEHISKGSEVNIEGGFFKVADYNGSVLIGTEHRFDGDGNEEVEDSRPTLRELAHMMQDVDGKVHNLIFDN